MGAAERGQEVVERFFVGQVQHAQPKPNLRAIAAKEIVGPHAEVEKVARRDAWWIRHIVSRTLGWNPQSGRSVVHRCAICSGQRPVEAGDLGAAEESDRRLLICRQVERVVETPDGTGDQPGVVPPGECHPGAERFVRSVYWTLTVELNFWS